jgi:hypothetical protein
MDRLAKRLAAVAMTCALALQTGVALARPGVRGTAGARTKETRQSGEPVIDWNRDLLSIVRTPGAQPPSIQPTRNFAILQAAIYDAVNSIDRSHEPYLVSVRAPRGASETAAADAAAHAALVGLYPAQRAALDADYATELSQVPDGHSKDQGIRVGEIIARDLLAVRTDDGSNIPAPPFTPGSVPGDYRPTPPDFSSPVFTTWGHVIPFVLHSGDQFQPPAPPPLSSDAYAAAVKQVKRLGSASSTSRSALQTEIGTFWSPPIQNFWNEIAQEVAIAHHTDLARTARLFAALDLSFADLAIAFYDAKYTYQLWRPVTAIRMANTDGNPSTVADPNWLPLAGITPADPSYPGAHSTISAAGADVLTHFFGDHQRFSVTSPSLPGVTRSFTSFSGAEKEAGLSRIYAGVHTRLDHEAGLRLGQDVADFVLHNALLPRKHVTTGGLRRVA